MHRYYLHKNINRYGDEGVRVGPPVTSLMQHYFSIAYTAYFTGTD